MAIPSINSASSSINGASEGSRSKRLTQDTFLKLLVKQMEYQNPLEPMKNNEFTAQLAQFAGLDQLYGMNDRMGSLINLSNMGSKSNVASLIGKEVRGMGNKILLTEETDPVISYELSRDASQVKIDILDSNGKEVRNYEELGGKTGINKLSWDGKDNNGNKMDPGSYTFNVAAKDSAKEDVSVINNINGIITGVKFNQDIPYVLIGSNELLLSDVIEVRDKK